MAVPSLHFPYNPGILAMSLPFLSSSFGPLSSLALFSNLSSLSLSTPLARVPPPQLFLFSHGTVQSGRHVQFTTFCLLWTLSDASGCTLPYIYSKSLPLNCTLVWLYPQFIQIWWDKIKALISELDNKATKRERVQEKAKEPETYSFTCSGIPVKTLGRPMQTLCCCLSLCVFMCTLIMFM